MILIANSYASQENRYFLPGESTTLADPLFEVLVQDPNCEFPETRPTDTGVIIGLRAKNKTSATHTFRQGLDTLLKTSQELLLEFNRAVSEYKSK